MSQVTTLATTTLASNLTTSSTPVTLSTTTLITYEIEPDEPLGVSLGIFAAILFGSMVFIFILMGLCILGHTFYMRCLKRKHHEDQVEKSDKPPVVLDLEYKFFEEDDGDFENNTNRADKRGSVDEAKEEFTDIQKAAADNDQKLREKIEKISKKITNEPITSNVASNVASVSNTVINNNNNNSNNGISNKEANNSHVNLGFVNSNNQLDENKEDSSTSPNKKEIKRNTFKITQI